MLALDPVPFEGTLTPAHTGVLATRARTTEIRLDPRDRARLDLLNRLLIKELEVLELGSKIQSQVQSEVGKNQRDYFLREQLNLTGTHIGCDTSTCGCCTVHVDGDAVLSCSTLAIQCDGREVRTVEGLQSEDGTLHPIQQAFHENHGLQCGYCTPGMMMAAVGIIEQQPNATDDEIRAALEGNLCRCTGYQNIVASIRAAADQMARS